MGMGHFRQSTPESGLDVIMGTLPLDLAILGSAIKARIRTKDRINITWNGKGTRNRKSHFNELDEIIASMNLSTGSIDRLGKSHDWASNYSVDQESLLTGLDQTDGLRLYTDGSKMGDLTGYGAALYNSENILIDTVNGKLTDNATVFQAECVAMELGLTLLESAEENSDLTILTDSQALIKAINTHEVNSSCINQLRTELKAHSEKRSINIKWIKAHIGHPGNEMADELAKDGASGLGNGPPIQVGSSNKVISSEVNAKMEELWKIRWEQGKDARQTRIFFPTINLSKSKKIRKMNRKNVSNMVRAITGHDFRRRHQTLMEGEGNNMCRLCGEEEESSSHLVDRCPRLQAKRMEVFGTPPGSAVSPIWKPEQLAAFLSDPLISEMEASNGED